MRGKNILWLSLIVMLLSVTMVNIGTAPPAPAKLYVDPPRLPEQAGTLGHPGDEYIVSINAEKVKDLYAAGFTLKISPYASVLVAGQGLEGDFLSEGDTVPTAFVSLYNAHKGTIKVGITRLGAYPGVSGNGILVSIPLTVRESGECAVELLDSYLIDSNGAPINHNVGNSFYYGPTANLIRASMPDGRRPNVGDEVLFLSSVVNKGDVPLTVRTRFDIERVEDGRRIKIYSGQNYAGGGLGEPLPFSQIYLDEYNEWYYEWNNPATNALGMPDGNYIEGDTDAAWASLYSFEDISLAGREIAYIEIEGYSQYPNGATDGADIDLYAFTSVQGFAWLGSNYGTTTWGWHGVRWTADKVTDVCPELRDEATLNGMELMFYDFYGDAPDVLRVDSCRLNVYWSPITPVEPESLEIGPYPTTLELDPFTIAEVTEEMIGSYTVTATLEYTIMGLFWNEGAKVRTFEFQIGA